MISNYNQDYNLQINLRVNDPNVFVFYLMSNGHNSGQCKR